MKSGMKTTGWLIAALLTMSACEKMNVEENGGQTEPVTDGVQVSFSVTRFEQVPFGDAVYLTKAGTEISKICTRIGLAVFKGDEKVKLINQEEKDTDFGKFSLVLPKGDYTVVIIAHSGSGSATITSPEEVKFPSNKVTDTFYYCQDISVTDAHAYDVQMKRAVAMFRLFIEDNMPESVKTMQFKYTGGSSTLNARTGYGCVNSRQTETRDVAAAMTGKPSQFEIYTFPHAEEDQLKITVAALGSGETEVCSKVFEEVPVTRNVITQYKGKFFDSYTGGGSDEEQSVTFSLSADSAWTEVTLSY